MREKWKHAKKRGCLMLLILAAILVGGMRAPQKVQAAEKIPTKVSCGVGLQENSLVWCPHADGDYIKNVKSKSPYLKVKLDKKREGGSGIYFYCTKAGDYKFTFDLYKKNNVKRKSYTITVMADDARINMIKAVYLDGKNITNQLMRWGTLYLRYYTTKTSGKVKIVTSKNVTLKNINVNTLSRAGKSVTKKFKNGSKISFDNYAIQKDETYGSETYLSKYTIAYTDFEVLGYRKTDGELVPIYIQFITPAKKWAKVKE